MGISFIIGIIGSVILVIGAAYPVKSDKHPAKSVKNWLFALGAALMLTYSILNYFAGGSVLFILLQALIIIASIFMLANIKDTIDVPIIAALGFGLIVLALYLTHNYQTVIFICGLIGIGLGYVLKTGTAKRNLALALGSMLIVVYSYLVIDWIFFGLNIFFGLFSGYYAWKLIFNKS